MQVMLGVSLRARWDATLVVIITIAILSNKHDYFDIFQIHYQIQIDLVEMYKRPQIGYQLDTA